MSLWGKIADFTTSAQHGFLSNALGGAGLALGSYTLHKYYLDEYINNFISASGSLSNFSLWLLSAGGIIVLMQTVLTATLVKMTMNQSKVFLKQGK